MSANITARFFDPAGVQTPRLLKVEGASYGLVAVQQGDPTGVAIMCGASELQYQNLLRSVIRWGVASDYDRGLMMATIMAALGTP